MRRALALVVLIAYCSSASAQDELRLLTDIEKRLDELNDKTGAKYSEDIGQIKSQITRLRALHADRGDGRAQRSKDDGPTRAQKALDQLRQRIQARDDARPAPIKSKSARTAGSDSSAALPSEKLKLARPKHTLESPSPAEQLKILNEALKQLSEDGDEDQADKDKKGDGEGKKTKKADRKDSGNKTPAKDGQASKDEAARATAARFFERIANLRKQLISHEASGTKAFRNAMRKELSLLVDDIRQSSNEGKISPTQQTQLVNETIRAIDDLLSGHEGTPSDVDESGR